MKWKQVLGVMLISASTAVLSVWGYGKLQERNYIGVANSGKLPDNYSSFTGSGGAPAPVIDFTPAANAATPAVVHIKTTTKARQVTNNQRQRNPFSDFFGDDFGDFFGGPRVYTIPEQQASGSGAIVSQDGYIITNNHVIKDADDIQVTLKNKKTYKATLVSSDPSTDLAVIKIDEKNLPYLVYGNSDDVKLGQWVLAVGYPLNLDVTVTAGIVSAKARAIGINDRNSNTAIESFIQTDAAVNPGNSGGPLINVTGELIGINSAIASPTGSYAGYSYAIPVNIVKKVVQDMIKYGMVQRAYVGIEYPRADLTAQAKKQLEAEFGEKWNTTDGIFVSGVTKGGAAEAAGVKKGDVITKINGVQVTNSPELQDQIARYKPGDKISISYLRNGKESTASVTLKNKLGSTSEVKATSVLDVLGGELVTIDKKTAQANGITGGVLVKKKGSGALGKSRIEEDFIIISANGSEINSTDDLKAALSNQKGTVYLEGFFNGAASAGTYRIPVDLSGNTGE